LSLEDAYEKINDWVKEYNCFRPHSSLKEMTPQKFIEHYEKEKQRRRSLPGASLPEAMYFAATESPSAASENTYLHEENLSPSNSPKSPT
jgi:putative transposase